MSHVGIGKKLRAWGCLLRLPNLFTVPGEALAGYLLASGGRFQFHAVIVGLVVLALYAGGLLLNDFFDYNEDLRDRPDRPLPAGAVSRPAVLIVGLMLLVLAPLAAFLVCTWQTGAAAVFVSLTVIAYDAGLKKQRLFGPFSMGLCRGGSILIGALAAGALFPFDLFLWMALVLSVTYTAAVTVVAADETQSRAPDARALIPGALLMFSGMFLLIIGIYQATPVWISSIVFAIAAVDVLVSGRRAMRGQIPCPAFIGRSIRAMLLIQAAWATLATSRQSWTTLITVLAVFVLARILADLSSRKFYGS